MRTIRVLDPNTALPQCYGGQEYRLPINELVFGICILVAEVCEGSELRPEAVMTCTSPDFSRIITRIASH